MPETDLFGATLLALMLGVAGIVGLTVLDSAASSTGQPFPEQQQDTVLLDGTSFTTIDDFVSSSNETVRDSRGNALEYDAVDQVTAPVPEPWPTANWTACAAARLNGSAATNETYTVLASENGSATILYDHENWRAYYDNGSANATVSLDAPSPTNGFTNLCARYNETANELVLRRNGTQSSPVGLDTAATSRNVSFGWEGRLDEIRAFNESVSNATLQGYTSDPIAPRPDTGRVLRILADAGEGDTATAYFVREEFDIDGAEWATGISGTTLDEGTDYEWRSEGPQLRAVSGGRIDGAPVAFATYQASTVQNAWTDTIVQAFSQIGVVFTVMILVVIVSYLMLLRGRGGL